MEGAGAKSSGGRSKASKIGSEFKWLKDTRWHWNGWRDVALRSDGSFLAPAEGCEREGNPACRWYTDEDSVYVLCAPLATARPPFVRERAPAC